MTNDSITVMNDTAKKIKDVLVARMSIRIEAMKTFEPASLEQLPNEVKISREQEASKLRAVIQEQKDLIDLLTIMYPGA